MIEDEYPALEQDQQAGPVLHAALALLVQVVAMHQSSPPAAEGELGVSGASMPLDPRAEDQVSNDS